MDLCQWWLYCMELYAYISAYITHVCRDHNARIAYVWAEQLPDDGLAIKHMSHLLLCVHAPHCHPFYYPSDDNSGGTEADSENICIDPEPPPIQTHIYGTPHLDNHLASKPISNKYFDIFIDEIDIWSQFSYQEKVDLRTGASSTTWGELLSTSCSGTLWCQLSATSLSAAQYSKVWTKCALRWAWTVGNSANCVISVGQSKQPSWRWVHTFLSPQSCSIHWVPHAVACIQGTYVVCSSKRIP